MRFLPSGIKHVTADKLLLTYTTLAWGKRTANTASAKVLFLIVWLKDFFYSPKLPKIAPSSFRNIYLVCCWCIYICFYSQCSCLRFFKLLFSSHFFVLWGHYIFNFFLNYSYSTYYKTDSWIFHCFPTLHNVVVLV